MEEFQIVLKDCPLCKNRNPEAVDKCMKCGYPFSGTKEEQAKFVGQQIIKKSKVKDGASSIRTARVILIILVLNNLLWFIVFAIQKIPLDATIYAFLAICFTTCAILVTRFPIGSMILPLVLLITWYTVLLLFAPDGFFAGLLWKITYVLLLAVGLGNVMRARRIRKQNDFLAEQ